MKLPPMPPVSAIMPVHNGLKYLAKAVDSIVGQKDVHFELLAVDDGSTDGSREYLVERAQNDGRIRVLSLSHSGISAAMNLGLSEARYDTIAVAEQDDISLPTRFFKQLKFMQDFPEAPAVSTWGFYIGARGRRFGLTTPGPVTLDEYRLLAGRGGVHLLSPSVMFKRETALNVGGFDPAFDGCQDEHLWNRMRDRGPILAFPEPLIEYRLHPDSMSRSSFFRQTLFGAYLQDQARSSVPGSLEQYRQDLKGRAPLRYMSLQIRSLGYLNLRRSGAFLADRRFVRALPHLFLGSFLHPRLAMNHLRSKRVKDG